MSRPPSRVLVTRSEPAAWETAERLRKMDFDPIVEPVFAVEPIDAAFPAFDALAFTSANAVREFARRDGRRDAPVFCVGARTLEAAQAAGFSNPRSADGDVTALAALILRELPASARLFHPGNEESRGDLAGQLRAQSRTAEFIAIYRAVPLTGPGPVLAAQLAGEKRFEAIVVHSPRSAAILAGFIGSGRPVALNVAAISEAAAQPVRGLAKIAVAEAPNEAALLEALEKNLFFD